MKILDIQNGKPVWEYEVGDQAEIIASVNFLLSNATKVTITNIIGNILEVASKNMRENGWGNVCIECEHVIPAGKTKAQIPALLQEWKENQVRKLLGVDECLKKMKESSKA